MRKKIEMKMGLLSVSSCLLTALYFAITSSVALAGPRVVASIKPIHSLVAGVMGDRGELTLLIAASTSPHTYSLRPSDAKALSEADLVFWVGREMETFLERPLRSLAGGARVVELSSAPRVHLLENRAAGAWETHDEAHDPDEANTEHHEHEANNDTPEHDNAEAGYGKDLHEQAHRHGEYNLHIWLDPNNAIAIVEAVMAVMSEVDPHHALNYAENGAELVGRLQALERELKSDLTPLKDTPFVVFHDAYHYFEEHYDLNAVGSITVSPDRMPGVKRISEMRRKIKDLKAACIFTEPQFSPRLVDTLIEGTTVRQGILDPLGADHIAGPKAYFSLMRGLTKSLRECLAFPS